MKKEFGQQVKALYSVCSELPKHEQINFLNTCNYSEDIKKKVTSLLNYSGDIDADLSQVILDSTKKSLNLKSIKADDIIDKYQLIELIGEGGQGEVWLANRIDGEFNHKVAIKFIKLSANEIELQRFQTERELLASLQHNNIATLMDGGKYQDRLYMVMEWIDGVQLLEHITHKKLTLKQTLRCFLQICHAVSYAHSKGIIHRDIKPTNILITKGGVVKLLDFGIAKSLNSEVTKTQNDIMLTLAYSSPEQINGEPVSIATDIYALGLILYEVFTSKRAQDDATASHTDFIKAISNITPIKPSVVNHVKGIKFPQRLLKGDLDNLVMMAIRKEPARRYKNVYTLIEDVENYLQSKPLLASGDSFSYKIKKRIKRNPLASLLTTFVCLLLLALPIIMYQHAKSLEKERDIANEKSLIAEKTTDFLKTLFESSSPLGNNGKTIDLKDVLAQGERQLAQGLGNQPKVAASIYMTLAQVQFHLAQIELALKHYRKAAGLYEKSGDTNGHLTAIGQLAVISYRNDEFEQSKRYFQLADKISRNAQPFEKAWLNIKKATIANEKNHKPEAIKYANNALAILTPELRKNSSIMGRINSELSQAYRFLDTEKALNHTEKSLKFAELESGKNHPTYLGRLQRKALLLRRLYKNGEAEIVLNELVTIAESVYSKTHPSYAGVVAEIGSFHHDRGEFDKALTAYNQAIEIYINVYGKSNYNYARMINNIAFLFEDMQEFKKAESLYSKSLEIRKKLDPDNIYRIASAKSNLARLLSKTGRFEKSQELIKSVIPVFTLNKRDNLYNSIITLANTIGDGRNTISCNTGIEMLNEIEVSLSKKSENSWRRMAAELWIGQMLNSCGYSSIANLRFDTASTMSKTIYRENSKGQSIIQTLVNNLHQE